METTVKLYALKAIDLKAYAFAALFVTGNIALPQLCHLIPAGGMIFLPIYFFTLIAAYKYGYITGLITALASPIMNHVLFGMPATEMLPTILIKSTLLAFVAAFLAQRTLKVSWTNLVVIILFYQGMGLLFEYALTNSFAAAFQDVRLGFPGLVFQLVGGYFCLKAIEKW